MSITASLDILAASAPPNERRIIEEFKAVKLEYEARWSAAALQPGYDERAWYTQAVRLESEYRQRLADARGAA